MKKKKTVLIFGVSSFIGSNLAEILKDHYRVVGTYYETPVNIKGVLSIKCDVNMKEIVQKIVFLFKPDITIYTIGLTDLSACQDFPKVADALNTVGVFNVSNASERYNSKFVYLSSGYIFSGENILFRENDTPLPTSVYGNTVASSEFFIQKSCLNYLIFRCCPIFGRSYNVNDLKWVEAIERSDFLGNKIVCDNKVYTGFIDIYTLGDLLIEVLEKDVTNRLLQVSSTDMMTRYEFAKIYLDIFGGNSGLLSKGDWDFPRTENQLALQNLTDELFFNLDIFNITSDFETEIPSIKESIERYFKKLSGDGKAKKLAKTGINFI